MPQISDDLTTGWRDAGKAVFWIAVILTGVGAGIGAAALTELLEAVQHWVWSDSGEGLLAAAEHAGPLRHVEALLGAGAVVGIGQLVLVRVTSGNGIDISEAIWFSSGRLPSLRTLGSAVLSVIIVGMGTSLGREGAPKQAGAVIANLVADRSRLSDEQRRLLVACGAGAGMSAAYGVPLGGALFALEVLRGTLALRFILPALVTSLIATAVSWTVLPDEPTYLIPDYPSSASVICWAVAAGPIIGVVSVGYVRMIAYAVAIKPTGWRRLLVPMGALGLLGVISIAFPQLLGNGKDIAELAFLNQVTPMLLLALLFLKPAATAMCVASGAPGGLFTPSLALGALLGGALGLLWTQVWPGIPPGLFAVLGATAVLAATTQGPISAVVLTMELTGRDRSFIIPLLLTVAIATLVARAIDPRSIYDARLSDEQVEARRQQPG
jgi:H+/Cl- antiporter ClcA